MISQLPPSFFWEVVLPNKDEHPSNPTMHIGTSDRLDVPLLSVSKRRFGLPSFQGPDRHHFMQFSHRSFSMLALKTAVARAGEDHASLLRRVCSWSKTVLAYVRMSRQHHYI